MLLKSNSLMSSTSGVPGAGRLFSHPRRDSPGLQKVIFHRRTMSMVVRAGKDANRGRVPKESRESGMCPVYTTGYPHPIYIFETLQVIFLATQRSSESNPNQTGISSFHGVAFRARVVADKKGNHHDRRFIVERLPVLAALPSRTRRAMRKSPRFIRVRIRRRRRERPGLGPVVQSGGPAQSGSTKAGSRPARGWSDRRDRRRCDSRRPGLGLT